jgi:hypothetical protein
MSDYRSDSAAMIQELATTIERQNAKLSERPRAAAA